MTPPAPLPRTAAHIPWGYGRTRITAMSVDPERIHVYWEITDDALEQGRARLGPPGADAVLVIRIHDTTGRVFDGNDSHGSFDIEVSRSDRQWFAAVNRPHSSAVVELGLRASDGSYCGLARSRRVDFPRRGPAPEAAARWGVAGQVLAVPSGHGPAGEDVSPRARYRIEFEENPPPARAFEASPAGGAEKEAMPGVSRRPPEDAGGGESPDGSEERLAGRAPGGASEERLKRRPD